MLLLALGERRMAVLWSLSVGLVVSVILALKLSFSACAPPSPFAAIHSPSGHTAVATMVYGGTAALLGGAIAWSLVQALAVAALIGTTRVLLGAHSPPEAVLGGAVGLLGVAILAARWRLERAARQRALAVMVPLLVIVLAVALHGRHVSAESVIRPLAWRYWPLRACGQWSG